MAEHDFVSVADWDNESWSRLVGAVTSLEAAWKTSSFPELSRFVPTEDDLRREAILVELIKVDQEYRWRAGKRSRVEDYLEHWPELNSNPQAVASLLAAECLTRATLDVMPEPAEIQQRFPQLAGSVPWEDLRVQARGEQLPASNPSEDGSLKTSDTFRRSVTSTLRHGGRTIEVGDRIDRFEVRKVIGRGGMGVVFHAFDLRLKRDVALKIPHLGTVDREVAERFLEEARIAAGITHPHICPVHDHGEADGIPYLVMPLVKGEPLDDWLKRNSPRPESSAEIVLKLAKAVGELHSADILHLDIKPQNIVIDERGEPLLMDFGLAWRADANSTTLISDALVGTPAYMAPEQVCGSVAEIDRRTDIYSLGVLLYELLTGHPPFQGTLTQVLAKIPHGGAESPRQSRPELDAELENICLRAMATKSTDRFQTAAELIDALNGYLQRMVSRASKARERRRFLVWSLVAGVLLLAIGTRLFLDWNTNRASNSLKTFATPIQRTSVPQIDPVIERIRQAIAGGVSTDPSDEQVVQLRLDLLDLMQKQRGQQVSHEAARLLVKLPWPDKPTSDDPNVWMKTAPKPDDATSGTLLERCQLPAGANVIIRGQVKHIPYDASHGNDSFWIWFEQQKPVAIQLFSLTPGFEFYLTEHWPTPNKQGDSNSQLTKDGLDFHTIPPPMEPPENFVRFRITKHTDGHLHSAEYILHVWQTEPPLNHNN